MASSPSCAPSIAWASLRVVLFLGILQHLTHAATIRRTTDSQDEYVPCSSDGSTFKCEGPSSLCIPVAAVCDGKVDCADSRLDESKATCGLDTLPQAHQCPSSQPMQCRSTAQDVTPNCIGLDQVCDGVPDCGDSMDEEHCCSAEQFTCPMKSQYWDAMAAESGERSGGTTSRCLNTEQECNGVVDCLGGEDEEERHCASPIAAIRLTEQCSVFPVHICDGRLDCLDGADEENCTMKACDPGLSREDVGPILCYGEDIVALRVKYNHSSSSARIRQSLTRELQVAAHLNRGINLRVNSTGSCCNQSPLDDSGMYLLIAPLKRFRPSETPLGLEQAGTTPSPSTQHPENVHYILDLTCSEAIAIRWANSTRHDVKSHKKNCVTV